MKDHPEKHEISQLVPQYWLRIKNKGGRSNETKKCFHHSPFKKEFRWCIQRINEDKGREPTKKKEQKIIF